MAIKKGGCVVFWPSSRPNMPFQSDAPEGSDTFQCQLWEEIALVSSADNMGQGEGPTQSDAPEESDLWTAWQLFPLDDDQTCHSKDWVGDWVDVELLYNSVKTEVRQLEKSCW